MSEKYNLQKDLQTILANYKILPCESWKKPLRIHHFKPERAKENKNSTFRQIRDGIEKTEDGNEKEGLYIYRKGGRTLYVGEGKLVKRIESHYIESYKEVPERSKKWYAFFSKHLGELTVCWRECKDEELRKTYEKMLTFVLKPEFMEEK